MIDNTPAGIFAAMMRANAVESTAPQNRLYGLLSDHLQRTLANTYGDAAPAIYGAIIRSGEVSPELISDTLADHVFRSGGLISIHPYDGALTYIGPAIHDGSPAEHVRAALTVAQDRTRTLSAQLDTLTVRLTVAAPNWTPMPCPRPHRSR